MSGADQRFAVVGAGIVGVCCALHLQRAGHRVTLLDAEPPGQGCSYGNGGLLQVGACIPLGTPAVLTQLPRMLMDPLSPMRIRWADLPWLWPFLSRFAIASLPGRFEGIVDSLARLLRHAWEAYQPILREHDADRLVRRAGELYVYESDASFASARRYHDMRRTRGISVEYLDGDGAREIEPALGKSVRHAAWLDETVATTDPFVLTQHLAASFAGAGGRILRARVLRLESNDRRAELRIESGILHFDAVVIAAGFQSVELLAPLGLVVPMRPERGHHLMLPNPGVSLRTPIVSGDSRFGLIQLAGGIRLVGSSELGRPERAADFSRIERMLEPAGRLLPGLSTEGATRWYGSRPTMPDSLPVIARLPGRDNILLAFGHGHLGLTLAGITGRLVAEMASGVPPSVDLSPFAWPRPRAARHIAVAQGQPMETQHD